MIVATPKSFRSPVTSNQLADQHVWLVERLVFQLGCRNRQEGISAGNLALVEASRTYQPHRGSFTSYAGKAIRRAIHEVITHEATRRTCRLSGELCAKALPEPSYDAERLQKALAGLPQDLAMLVRQHYGMGDLEPASMVEIARRQGVGRRKVKSRLVEAMAMLEEAMG